MSVTTERLVVAVLSGGNSPERSVSLNSGAHVRQALESCGHAVVPVDPQLVDVATFDWTGIDVAFNALHGPFGEDGQVQAILERCGVPYTGSGVEASKLAMSKSAAKERFVQRHVPTPEYVLVHATDAPAVIRNHAARIGYPLVVKPNSQGSSLGVTIIRDEAELAPALARAFELDAFGLLERAIPGQEWTAGLVDEELLPLIHIQTEREFFDFQAKYEDDDTRYLFDSDTPHEVIERIGQAARGAAMALGTSGLCRVDVRVDAAGQPWVLEVNTVPGFTDHSLVPKMLVRKSGPGAFAAACDQAARAAMWQRSHLRRRARVA